MALFRLRPSTMPNFMQAARCLVACNTNSEALLQHIQHNTRACGCTAEGPSTSYPSFAPALQWHSHRTFFGQFNKPNGKVYKERRLIGYSPEQLYAVVSNVQHYHQFVPWCVGSNIIKRSEDGSYLEAELQIGFQMINERYTSRVKLQAPHSVSSTVADSALFHHLESIWHLKQGPNPESTWLSFSVDFAFLNPLYANIAQLFFSEVVTRMMGAFEGRCQQLYGPPSFSPAGQKHLVQQQQQQHKHHRPAVPRIHLHQAHKQQAVSAAAKQQHLQDVPHVAAAGAAGAVVQRAAAVKGPASSQQQRQQQQHRAGPDRGAS